jgi:LDH2 family malate/lactate/ureidoglycolate dehydrogenase
MTESSPQTGVVRVPAGRLRAFCEAALKKAGLTEEDARLVADTLVEADLRGVRSHGLILLVRYCRGLLKGYVNPRPRVRVERRVGATALMDGDNGLGQIPSVRAMELAETYGVGTVVVYNSNHFGAAAYYALKAVPRRMIGFAATNAPPVMPLFGGRDAVIGNNPLCWAIPAKEEPPLVLDMACSASSRGKIRVKAQRGEPIPLGWALDAEGRPTTDPLAALAGVMLPVGGYKGAGLAVVIEALAGGLSGAKFGFEIETRTVRAGDPQESWQVGHLFQPVKVEAFLPFEEFGSRVDRLIWFLRSGRPAPGSERVYLPGEPEHIARADALANGIPFEAADLYWAQVVAEDLGIEPLKVD